MDRISIEHLSVFGLPPVQLVNLAADLGCQYISIALSPIIPFNPHKYPLFSLKDDPALRRAMKAALRERGVSITLGSGYLLNPESDVGTYKGHLDAMADLGVRCINSITSDRELPRAFDNFGKLAELAASFGIQTAVEIIPGQLVGTLERGVACVRHVGRKDFRLTIDTMHVSRAGGTAAEIKAMDPEVIGYIQLCDAPMIATHPNYSEECIYYRQVPGKGELPLFDLMDALPRNLVVGLEIPMRAEAEAGIGPYDRLRPCVEEARKLLAQLDTPH